MANVVSSAADTSTSAASGASLTGAMVRLTDIAIVLLPPFVEHEGGAAFDKLPALGIEVRVQRRTGGAIVNRLTVPADPILTIRADLPLSSVCRILEIAIDASAQFSKLANFASVVTVRLPYCHPLHTSASALVPVHAGFAP